MKTGPQRVSGVILCGFKSWSKTNLSRKLYRLNAHNLQLSDGHCSVPSDSYWTKCVHAGLPLTHPCRIATWYEHLTLGLSL